MKKTSLPGTGLRLAIFCLLMCQHTRAATFTVTPSAISNQYAGVITLQIGGLTNGETVVVQKYVDANTNGVVDVGDWLAQQFVLTDNQAPSVISGVTNINIPYDTNATAGAVTTLLSPGIEGIAQEFVGQFAFVLSSPTGRFTAITNLFNVTNSPYAQSFTGQVTCNGTNVPNAFVLLGSPNRNLNPLGGVVANNSGSFKLKAAPGTYKLIAGKNNFIVNGGAAPVITLGSGATIATNLTLIAATNSISGKFVDAANASLGLPAILMAAQSTNGLFAFGTTDTNGNFTVPVISGEYQIGNDQRPLDLLGYVGLNNNTTVDTSTGSVAGVTIAFPKATALIYGSVKDSLNNPLPGVVLGGNNGNNNSGLYQGDGQTDQNGNYVAGVVAGNWGVNVSGNENAYRFGNYIFSQGPPWTYNNGGSGTNLTAGMAALANFTAILATNQITGYVKDSGNNPIVGVQVFANVTINGSSYNTQANTDGNGNYLLNVANGGWNISVYCCCDNNSLDSILGSGNYQCPNNQNVNISNNNGAANFTVQLCSGVQINTTNLPNGQVGVFYDQFLQASSCNGNVSWTLNDPQNFPSSLTLDSNGQIHGTPAASGTYNFSVHADDGNGHTANQGLALNITGGSLQITTTYLPNGTNGAFYSQAIQATGGQTPYGWTIPNYSAPLPPNLSLSSGGVLSGTLVTNGTFYFDVLVTDASSATFDQTLSLTVVNPPLPPLIITNVSLPKGNVGAAYSAQLGATGGEPPYTWSVALGSASPPPGLTLQSSGLISGTPTNSGLFNFKAQVADMNSTTTNKVMAITINPKPSLSSPAWLANGRFQLSINGSAGQNYTVQYSSTLTNWTTLFVTNSPVGSFTITDSNATTAARFYRVLIGP